MLVQIIINFPNCSRKDSFVVETLNRFMFLLILFLLYGISNAYMYPPSRALMSMRCETNPPLDHAIANIGCAGVVDMQNVSLACLNTKKVYICLYNKWELYE